MGLNDLIDDDDSGEKERQRSDSIKHDKLTDDGLCPNCGERGEETEHWYWRCPNDCDTVTYIPTENMNELP